MLFRSFFILSGFVISWSSNRTKAPEPFTSYFLKRAARIYCVWTAAAVAMFLIAWAEKGQIVYEPAERWLGNFLMLQDWKPAKPAVICTPIYGNSPLWSLHYEWWFYMLFPAVLRLVRESWRSGIVGVSAIGHAIVYAWLPNPISRLFMYLSIWWIGVHAATTLRARGKVRLVDLALPLLCVFGTALPGLFTTARWLQNERGLSPGLHPILEVRHCLSAIAVVLTAFAWRGSGWWGFSHIVAPFAVLAPISFSLYAIHYRSIAQASYLSFLGNPLMETIFYSTVTLAFCCFSELVLYPKIRSWLRLGGS
mgnify:CR=1 FL=1